jgi:hypothetical protein
MIPLVLGLFGALFYFGNSEVRRFENLAAKDIRTKIRGEQSKVSVRTELNGIIAGPLGDMRKVTIRASNFETDGVPIFTQPELSKKGIVRNLRIELKEFKIAGLLVKELVADIPDCRYDYTLAVTKRKIRLSQSGVGRGEVTIREKDLESYILHKYREIKKVSVKVANDKVHVEGYGEFLIIKTNFSVDATLSAMDGTKLALDQTTIYFDGILADDVSKQALLETLNPVVDLAQGLKLYDAILVDRIVLRNGVIRAMGATKIPVQPPGILRAQIVQSLTGFARCFGR